MLAVSFPQERTFAFLSKSPGGEIRPMPTVKELNIQLENQARCARQSM
jgi:hypothetical protein